MNWFFSRLIQRNTVFALGLGVPLVFFGSTTVTSALVIGLAVLYVVPATYATLYFIEHRIPKPYRLSVLLLVAAVHESLFESVLLLVMPFPGSRLLLFVRMVAVDATILYPFQTLKRQDSIGERLLLVGSLVAGFLIALAFFTVVRYLLGTIGFTLAMSTTVGFFILGYGKAIYRFILERTS